MEKIENYYHLIWTTQSTYPYLAAGRQSNLRLATRPSHDMPILKMQEFFFVCTLCPGEFVANQTRYLLNRHKNDEAYSTYNVLSFICLTALNLTAR